MVAERLARVQQQIADACHKHGRDPKEITLVAVSKTYDHTHIYPAFEAGQRHFGENKVQEYVEKVPQMPYAHWHIIGPLQTNKVKFIVDNVYLLHTLDRLKLAREIEKRAQRKIDCLIQVNISNEPQKSGVTYEALPELLAGLQETPKVQVKGLMGIAENAEDDTRIRAQFAGLKAAYDQIQQAATDQIQMQYLSMGMSGDYELAIAEGANMLRIGSAIFGKRA